MEAAEKARRARFDAVKRRGESVWTEIETEIERRNGYGYDHAAALLADLKQLAAEQGAAADFSRRLAAIRKRHARKGQFIRQVLTIIGVTAAAEGDVSVVMNRTELTFQSTGTTAGSDSFTYYIQDTLGAVTTASVAVTINMPANSPPDAVDDGPYTWGFDSGDTSSAVSTLTMSR